MPEHTKSLHMLDMLLGSSEERIPIEALVELEIQVVLELANSEEYLCSKFEEGLSLEIREKMSVSGSQKDRKSVV